MLGLTDRLSVLIYHRVHAAPDPMFPEEVDAARFEAQMRGLARYFNPMSLPDAVTALEAGRLPARAVTVTFDDGYADNLTVALPIATRHGVPMTVFVASGYLDGGIMFNDVVIEAMRRTTCAEIDLSEFGAGSVRPSDPAARRSAALAVIARIKYIERSERDAAAMRVASHAAVTPPRDLMLTTGQLRDLRRGGATIGAHTVSHPILSRLAIDEAQAEIADGRARLEALLNEPIAFFAYPNGKPGDDYNPIHVSLVRELGFRAAFSTAWGSATAGSDPYQLPRFTPWDASSVRFLARLMVVRARSDVAVGSRISRMPAGVR